MHNLLDLETPLASADALASLSPDFAGTIINARQARALLENPSLTAYDNPSAMLMCVYKPDRALCNRMTSAKHQAWTDASPPARTSHEPIPTHSSCDKRQNPWKGRPRRPPSLLGTGWEARARRLRPEADQHDRSRIIP